MILEAFFFICLLLRSLIVFFSCTSFVVAGLTLAPLLVKVDPNINVILTACLTVYVGCYRSVKPTPPTVSIAGIDSEQLFLLSLFLVPFFHGFITNFPLSFSKMQETMSNEHAMRFPFVGSAMLLSLFLLFKFLSKDLVNAVLTCYFFVLGIIALSWVPLYLLLILSYIKLNQFCSVCYMIWCIFFFLFSRATILPAMKRFLPEHWNEDLIVWHFPYFRCMWPPCISLF